MRKRYGLLMDADQPEGVNGITMPTTALVGVANAIFREAGTELSDLTREVIELVGQAFLIPRVICLRFAGP